MASDGSGAGLWEGEGESPEERSEWVLGKLGCPGKRSSVSKLLRFSTSVSRRVCSNDTAFGRQMWISLLKIPLKHSCKSIAAQPNVHVSADFFRRKAFHWLFAAVRFWSSHASLSCNTQACCYFLEDCALRPHLFKEWAICTCSWLSVLIQHVAAVENVNILMVFTSLSVFRTCPHSSPLSPSLSTTTPCPWSAVQGGGPSLESHPGSNILSAWHTVALWGEVVLHHKPNKSRNICSVYSSWHQEQTLAIIMTKVGYD